MQVQQNSSVNILATIQDGSLDPPENVTASYVLLTLQDPAGNVQGPYSMVPTSTVGIYVYQRAMTPSDPVGRWLGSVLALYQLQLTESPYVELFELAD